MKDNDNELPSQEQMVAEILQRPETTPDMRFLFEMLQKNALRRIEMLGKAYARQEKIDQAIKDGRRVTCKLVGKSMDWRIDGISVDDEAAAETTK